MTRSYWPKLNFKNGQWPEKVDRTAKIKQKHCIFISSLKQKLKMSLNFSLRDFKL